MLNGKEAPLLLHIYNTFEFKYGFNALYPLQTITDYLFGVVFVSIVFWLNKTLSLGFDYTWETFARSILYEYRSIFAGWIQ